MLAAVRAEPCTPDQFWCTLVHEQTGSDLAARLADYLVGRPLAITGIVLLGLVIRWLAHRFINRVATRAAQGLMPGKVARISIGHVASIDPARRVQRAQAMGSLLGSIATGIIVAITSVMVLAELGINIGPLIAGAGIVGVALGFGAQSLVKDFISGVFMIFEDQYGVGDVINTGEASGTVEAVGLRVTRLRDVEGTVWYVRNGEVLRIGNMSQGWAKAVLDIGVGYGEDIARVRRVLLEVAEQLRTDPEYAALVLDDPEVLGVQDLAADSVTVRLTVKTAPLQQWTVARALRERIKARFDEDRIEIPFPQRVVWHRPEPDADPGVDPGTVPHQR